MNLLYPKVPREKLAVVLRVALLGALVAGVYGAVHDQISYSISAEYFTKLKFHQFSYLDFGWPPRAFAAAIGFVASFWVGFLGGWFVGRLGLAGLPSTIRFKWTIRVFGIVFLGALIGGLTGALIGMAVTPDGVPSSWNELSAAGVENPRGFVIVAYLHGGSYLGALIGLLIAIVLLRRYSKTRP